MKLKINFAILILIYLFFLITNNAAAQVIKDNPNNLPACTGGAIFSKDTLTRHNCWANFSIPQIEDFPANPKAQSFNGEWRNGAPNGIGTIGYRSGDRYYGAVKQGKANGYGIYLYSNYDNYFGELIDDKFNGKGVLTKANGKVFSGIWRNDQLISNGDVDLSDAKIFMISISKPNFPGIKNPPTLEKNTLQENKKIENAENKQQSYNVRLDEAKTKCKDLGFAEKTEKFGICVLKISK